eukprot:5557013-Lingulodinium_polyedra.AAC.1
MCFARAAASMCVPSSWTSALLACSRATPGHWAARWAGWRPDLHGLRGGPGPAPGHRWPAGRAAHRLRPLRAAVG